MKRTLQKLILCLALAGNCSASEPVQIVKGPISGHVHPSIALSAKGTLLVAFKSGQILKVSRSADRGANWSGPKAIATTANRPASVREVKRYEVYPGTLDVLPDDRLLLTWNYIADDRAKDKYYERALLYSLSEDDGTNWSDQGLIGPVNKKHLGAVRHNVLPWKDSRWLLALRVGSPRIFDPRTKTVKVFPLREPDGKQHEFQQIIRTASGVLLAMGPELLRSTDDGLAWSPIDFPVSPARRDNLEGRFLTPLKNGGVVVTWGVGHKNKGLHFNYSPNNGKTWNKEPVVLLPDTPIAARYYSARAVQLDTGHLGVVYMNRTGVYFLNVTLDEIR
ncbi:MAG: hypothetical protein CMO80_03985 [Verrucomicrobiales bacterium]|nr:hypothetical protein [Verrucomicrobiales bacterium]